MLVQLPDTQAWRRLVQLPSLNNAYRSLGMRSRTTRSLPGADLPKAGMHGKLTWGECQVGGHFSSGPMPWHYPRYRSFGIGSKEPLVAWGRIHRKRNVLPTGTTAGVLARLSPPVNR